MSNNTDPSSGEAAAGEDATSRRTRIRGKNDPAWGHAVHVASSHPGGKPKIRCMFCQTTFSGGGIHRVKLHLAGIPGSVKSCLKVDDEVRAQMLASIEGFDSRKRKEAEEYAERNPVGPEGTGSTTGTGNGSGSGTAAGVGVAGQSRMIHTGRSATAKKKARYESPELGSYFVPRTNAGDQPTIRSVLQTQEVRNKVDSIMNKWFLDASIPFNATTSKFYRPALDAIAAFGPGYKGPSMYEMRGPLLQQNVMETKKYVETYRKYWKETGCTIMADGWTDKKKRTLINFLVYCPRGMVFLKSVNATAYSKTGDYLFKLFSKVVRFVGAHNVVHFVTDNASNMVSAGKMLEKEFPTIYWSPCAAHCLNLIFTDIGKMEIVKNVVAHGGAITRYLYNHCYPLYLMRKFTKGREIIRPAQTRFATNFIALKSLLDQRKALRQMVVSPQWTSAPVSKDAAAKKWVELVEDKQFWKDAAFICSFSEPLVRVLRMVDSDERPAMGYVFGALSAAREEVEERFKRKKALIAPVLKAIDDRWDKHLCKNLHAAGFWFNPNNQYNENIMDKHLVTGSGVIDIIEKYANKNTALRSALTKEMKLFRNAEGDFGRITAINDRATMLPDEWWMTYGCSAPKLQKLAIRVLSQTCSASGCERNWSLFEHIHSKKRNRLEHQRMNDIVYVHYNLRLQQRSKLYARNFDPINLEDIGKFNEEWIVDEEPEPLDAAEQEIYIKNIIPAEPITLYEGDDEPIELELDDGDEVVELVNVEENADDVNLFGEFPDGAAPADADGEEQGGEEAEPYDDLPLGVGAAPSTIDWTIEGL